MKRRIVLILIVVMVIAVLGTGIFIYVRGTRGRLLEQARTKMAADKFEEAQAVIEKYIAENPDDSKGYEYKAAALVGQAKYDQARTALAEAIRLAPDNLSLAIELAGTHSSQAHMILTTRGALDITRLREAIDHVLEANDGLRQTKTPEAKERLAVGQRLGRNCIMLAGAYRALSARLLDREARNLATDAKALAGQAAPGPQGPTPGEADRPGQAVAEWAQELLAKEARQLAAKAGGISDRAKAVAAEAHKLRKEGISSARLSALAAAAIDLDRSLRELRTAPAAADAANAAERLRKTAEALRAVDDRLGAVTLTDRAKALAAELDSAGRMAALSVKAVALADSLGQLISEPSRTRAEETSESARALKAAAGELKAGAATAADPVASGQLANKADRLAENILRHAAKRAEQAHPASSQPKPGQPLTGAEASAHAANADKDATGKLLEVVTEDPTRDRAAVKLIELCRRRNDTQSRAKARGVILSAPSAPPGAATLILQSDLSLSSFRRRGDLAAVKALLERTDWFIKPMLARDKALGEAKLPQAQADSRAKAALEANSAEEARELCQAMLASAPRGPLDRMRRARALVRQAQLVKTGLDSLRSGQAVILRCEVAQVALDAVERELFDLRLDEADRLLGDVVSKHGKHVEARIARAKIALLAGKADKTRQICQEVLETSPHHRDAELWLGKAYAAQGQYVQAEHMLGPLRRTHDRWIRAHVEYAEVALRVPKQELAVLAMRQATKLDDGSGRNVYADRARRFMVNYHLRRGFGKLALEHAKVNYKAHPNDAEAVRLVVRAVTHTDQARSELMLIEQQQAGRPEMLIRIATGYRSLGDTQEFLRLLRRIAQAKTNTPDANRAVAKALAMLGRTSEAEKLLTAELLRNPHQGPMLFDLADLYAKVGRALDAHDLYHAAIRLQPTNTRYRLALIESLVSNTGDLDRAEDQLQELLKLDPTNSAAIRLRTTIALLQGKSVDAAALLQQVKSGQLSGLPLARVYLLQGRGPECIALCKQQQAHTPGDPEITKILAEAYSAMGRTDEAVEQWKKLLQARPEQIEPYRRLALALGKSEPYEQIAYKLADVLGAQRDLVDLTLGWYLTNRGDLPAAANVYARLAGRAEATNDRRGMALLLGSKCLALTNQLPKASEYLDTLAGVAGWRVRALVAKAELLMVTGQAQPAEAILSHVLKGIGVQLAGGNVTNLHAVKSIVKIYVRLGKPDEALAAAAIYRKSQPNDPMSYLLSARICLRAGRRDKAFDWYRQAIDKSPGADWIQVELAKALDAANEPRRAIDVLERLKAVGEAARATALYEQGAMFTRWGLQQQAIKCFEELDSMGHGGWPTLDLKLGMGFATLGEPARARAALEKIHKYAPQYVRARQLLAGLAETDQQKIAILDALAADRPTDLSVLISRMRVLAHADEHAKVVEVFEAFLRALQGDKAPPPATYAAAMTATLKTKGPAAAEDLARRGAKRLGAAWLQRTALMLHMIDHGEEAAAMMPKPAGALLMDAILGVAVSAKAGDAAATAVWADRVAELSQATESKPGPTRAKQRLARFRLLVQVAAGRLAGAKQLLSRFDNQSSVNRGVARDIIARAERGADATTEAASLLAAAVAVDSGLVEVGRTWAMETLQAHPKSQWAAELIFNSKPDAATRDKALATLRPVDCLPAIMARAQRHMQQRKYDQAAGEYAKAVAQNPAQADLLMNQAQALELAGDLAAAEAVYWKVWQATQSPAAGNAAAYLTTRLNPQDQKKLAAADAVVQMALEPMARAAAAGRRTSPLEALVRDTAGWIAYRQGKADLACMHLRRAVKVMNASSQSPPELTVLQYHLGVAEAAGGRAELARWRLQAAVSMGKRLQAQNVDVSDEVARAAKDAAKALAGLGPLPTP